MTAAVVHHGCGGHIVDGTCRACGRDEAGRRATPQGVDAARLALTRANTIRAEGRCLAEGPMTLDQYVAAVDACGCPIHRGDDA